MFDHQRLNAVRSLLFEFLKSPSLRHLRDPYSVGKLAEQILRAVDRDRSVWRKWEGPREEALRAAAACWIPEEDLQSFLNSMPGPMLTKTDVAQRLRAILEEPHTPYPQDELKEGCIALYKTELAAGTEMPAIIGALQEYVDSEAERLRLEREKAWREARDAEKFAQEQRFLAGADCKWTPVRQSKSLFIRKNGRAYRIDQSKDKRWHLRRVEGTDDLGSQIGTYGSRTDVTKALAILAYEPEPRW